MSRIIGSRANDLGNVLCISDGVRSNTSCATDNIGYGGVVEGNATAVAYACPNNASCSLPAVPPSIPTTVAPPPYRRFALYDARDRMQIATWVEVYQPLESGEGQIWAVREVASDGLQLSASTGQQLADGDLLWASATSEWMGSGSLGYRAGSEPASCDVSASTGLIDRPVPSTSGTATPIPLPDYSGGELTLDLSDADEGCADAEPGYAWVATADGGGSVLDPLAGGGQVHLSGLTASAVVFTLDEGQNVSTTEPTHRPPTEGPPTTEPDHPTTTTVPGDENINWTTYSSPLGWSIDLPSSWAAAPVSDDDWEASGRPLPLVQIVHDEQAEPADDSRFPLDIAVSRHEVTTFRGDGLAFDLVLAGSGADSSLTDEEADLMQEVVLSIRFEPWAEGDVRNGWARVMPPEETAGWFEHRGDTYLVFHEESSVGLEVFGPLPACQGQELALEAGGTNVVQTCAGATNTYGPDGAGGLAEYPVDRSRTTIPAWCSSRVSPLPPGRRPGALPAPGRRAPRSRGSSCS